MILKKPLFHNPPWLLKCISSELYPNYFLLFILPYFSFNLLTINVPYHMKTSQLIYNANQWTGSYQIRNIVC